MEPLISYFSSLESVAVACGLLSVWFSKDRNVLVYPVGLISTFLYVHICFTHGIYADMGVNLFFGAMSIYGWYRWYSGEKENERVRVTYCSTKESMISFACSLLLWLLIGLLLTAYTDSSVPILDSLTTAFSITGMYLMAEKKIENWIYWIIVDAISIPLFCYKDLYLSAFQFFIFCVLAVIGYLSWRNAILISKQKE